MKSLFYFCAGVLLTGVFYHFFGGNPAPQAVAVEAKADKLQFSRDNLQYLARGTTSMLEAIQRTNTFPLILEAGDNPFKMVCTEQECVLGFK